MLALIISLLAPTNVVLLPHGDALLLACHDDTSGWFSGRACRAAASEAKVVAAKTKPWTLPKTANVVNCGGTEGNLSFGKAAGAGVIRSAHRKAWACPERKPYTLPDKVAAAVHAAVVADHARNPVIYSSFSANDKVPFSTQYSMRDAVVIDIEGKGKTEEILSLKDVARRLYVLVRVDGLKVTILRVNPFGMLAVERGDCGDFDGDGVAEIIISNGGETERSYELVRFVKGEAETIAAMHCGD